jgi:DeoR family transcriptional regulator, aga operon transcriptional repressor
MASKTELRAERIMKELLRNCDVTVEYLVEAVGTSAPSIRRDLTRLERRGLLRRTHGGATLVEPLLYEPFRYDSSFQSRELRFAAQKRRIALAAAERIHENEIIGLTAGTTTTQIGRSLRHRKNIQVVTNGLNIGMELCNQPEIKTMLTGGVMTWAWAFCLSGQPAINFLKEVYLDKAFISVVGIDVARGATTMEPEEALVIRTMIKQARKVIVVADSSKIGQVSPAYICDVSEIHTLITDTGISADAVHPFIDAGIEVIRV